MNWRKTLMKLGGLTLASLAFCTAALAQIGASCGPIETNPLPPENPSVRTTVTVLPKTWNTAYYEWDVFVTAQNTGPLTEGNPNKLATFTMPDSAAIAALIPNGTWTKIANPSIVSGGNPTLLANTTWDGTAGNANLLQVGGAGGDTLGVNESITIKYSCRVTHGGAAGPWTARGWARGLSVATTVTTDSDVVTMVPPTAPETPTIGIARVFGAVTGTAPNYAVTCSTFIGNVLPGNVTINRIDVRDTVANIFTLAGGGSSLTSITGKSSKRFTFNAAFTGLAANAQMLSVLVADSLRIASWGTASKDTLIYTLNFNAGTATDFQSSAQARATNLANTITTADVSDWGNNVWPPGTPNGDDPSRFSIPSTVTAATDLEITAAGNFIGHCAFAMGALPASQLTSGTGLQLRNAALTTFPTQYSAKVLWPDGTVRVARIAANVPAAAVYDVIQPGAAQTGTPVATTTDPFFNVEINGVVYVLTASQFTWSSEGSGLVYKRGYYSFTDGGAAYQTFPGALECQVYVWQFADGTQRAHVLVKNQRSITSGLPIQKAATYGASGDPGAQQTAAWRVLRKTGRVMRARWASDSGLTTGDAAAITLWDTSSYTARIDGSTDPACANQKHSYGGKLRAGEQVMVQLTSESSAEPPQGWHTNDYYKLTAAIPFTDNLFCYGNFAYNGADSLCFFWQRRSVAWIETMDTNTPRNNQWQNIRDVGQRCRLFDSGSDDDDVVACDTSNAPSVFETSFHVGHDQYEENRALIMHACAASRETSDSVDVNHPTIRTKAFQLAEQATWSDLGPRYNLTYGPLQENYGHLWAHVTHSSQGWSSQGRSTTDPTWNYQSGRSLQMLAVMYDYPFMDDALMRMRGATKIARAMNSGSNNVWNAIKIGEGRTWGNYLAWTSLFYAMTDSTVYRDQGIDVIRNVWSNYDFDTPVNLITDACGSDWDQVKPWMWNYSIIELRQFIRELERHGDSALAGEMRDDMAEYQKVFYDNGWQPTSPNNRAFFGASYPLCNTSPSFNFPRSVYEWECDTNGVEWSDAPDFWGTVAGTTLIGYTPDPTRWKSLWSQGIRMIGSGGTSIQCYSNCEYNQGHQKIGIPMQLSWDALREYEGTLDNRPSGAYPTEVYWDE